MTVHHQGASGTHGSIRLTGKYNTPWTLSKKWIYNSATLVFVPSACSHSEQLRVQSLQIKLKIIFLTHIVSALRLRWPVVSFAFGIWRKLDSVVFSFQEKKKKRHRTWSLWTPKWAHFIDTPFDEHIIFARASWKQTNKPCKYTTKSFPMLFPHPTARLLIVKPSWFFFLACLKSTESQPPPRMRKDHSFWCQIELFRE